MHKKLLKKILLSLEFLLNIAVILPGHQSERPTDGSTTENSEVWTPAELVDFSQSSSADLSRENSVPIDWIRRLLTDDNVEPSSERK